MNFTSEELKNINEFFQATLPRHGRDTVEIPRAVFESLLPIVQALESGKSIHVRTLPSQLSPAVAASILGVSRPTVMKYIAENKLTSTKQGTHHRLNTVEVLKLRKAFEHDKARKRRQAALELLDFEDLLEEPLEGKS
ncbi:MAG: helix-turn-helix domain-containing protein [Corynebacterium sp.]|uniref:helix-turn-helix domain-containing protein n=1 Tax=Corynebacterium sp. TaxID=1720 RepID=UPI0026DABB6D|nr:helix-turn-helix domain-containing protein [Corynebacterium sp.]MDO4762131.1 helix-turn-helix domain-containing protein [Corynebacterium sp.]